ncbi:putative s-adenosylmethionine-dependent methyltransferase protein [Neofusicoccum parvum UCRNP2]|uniref:Protein-lysine N-methyltransferase EFM4 n=1 Tax=Botryosphaeria parva (strain UCR-NP2) TaxID=1287680 RepID=R1EUK4_BOTPV|nr:putative s-adenosylmethionine-dependent methyltransferase protein [Neofusicoccum parvum UCRNP2]
MAATDEGKPAHLDPSDLGTKAYWDECYSREIANHADDPDDEGTVWFSDAGAEERMLSYLEDLADEAKLVREKIGVNDGEVEEAEGNKAVGKAEHATSFLDLGTGNGHLLFALRDEGWEGTMIGVDYSAKSVQLARRIAATRRENAEDAEGVEDVRFEEWDILGEAPREEWLGEGFDVVLDKGTFDAISLSGETDAQGRRIFEGYKEKVEPLVKPGGMLLITSCNWTAEELKTWFVAEGGLLEYEDAISYPSFTFGGKTGQQVCSLCFRRKSSNAP